MGRISADFYAQLKRKCHDCGKRTNDYRCPKCLARWRAKHGVSQYAVGNGDITFYRTGGGRVTTPIHD